MRPASLCPLLFALACAPRAWTPLDPALLTRADFADAPSVVLLSEEDVIYHLDRGQPVADHHVHLVTRYQTRDAEQPAALTIPIDVSYDSVLSLRARTILPDGTSIDVDPGTAIDQPAFVKWMLYNDYHVLNLPQPRVPAGGIVEWEYVVRTTRPADVLEFSQQLAGAAPIERARFTASIPDGWSLDWEVRERGRTVQAPPEIAERDGARSYTWIADRVAPLPNEAAGPAPEWVARDVHVRLARWVDSQGAQSAPKDDRELSAWWYGFMAKSGATMPTAEMRKEVESVQRTAGSDPEAVARALYDFVANDVDYCAIELAEGGWRPHAPAEVFGLRYGDCKDKANLLRALLTLAGIDSQVAVLTAHQGFAKPFGLPVLNNFNHAILIVDLPGREVVVDPTARGMPFGELPAGDSGADLLPLTAAGAPLRKTPAPDWDRSSEDLTLTLTVSVGSAGHGPFELSATGALGWQLRQQMLSDPTAKPEHLAGVWLKLPGAKVERIHFDDAHTAAWKVSRAKGAVRLPELAVRSGGDTGWLLRPSELVPGWLPSLPVLNGGTRQTPLWLGTGGTRRLHATIKLPGGVDAARLGPLPKPVELDSRFGHYLLSWKVEGDTLRLESEVTLRQTLVAPEEYEEARHFFDQALAAEARPLYVSQEPQRQAAAAGSSR